jgi:hypothetical protein
MKKFLVLYHSSASAREQMANVTPEQMKAGMDMWMAWAAKHKSSLVDLGQPVGPGKHVPKPGAVENAKETVCGYSILQAGSLDEAVKTVHEHPHFHAPTASITVLEMMPVPGM